MFRKENELKNNINVSLSGVQLILKLNSFVENYIVHKQFRTESCSETHK
jgi:hypothetical protein